MSHRFREERSLAGIDQSVRSKDPGFDGLWSPGNWIIIVRNKITKNWTHIFWGGFTSFDCKISSKNFFCDALKVVLSFVKKKTNHPVKWKNLEEKRHHNQCLKEIFHVIFSSSKTLMLVGFFGFLGKAKLSNKHCFSTLMIFYYIK